MKRVIIESPFAGNTAKNLNYARTVCHEAVTQRGESAWGSHIIWPQFLDDNNQAERTLGMQAGLAWSPVADYHVFCTDLGWSSGMKAALIYCLENKRPFRLRSLGLGGPSFPFMEGLTDEQWAIIKSSVEDPDG